MSNAPVTAEDLYLYAMDLLDAEEYTRIREFLPRSPEARAELANVHSDLALFALAAEPQEVPMAARHRLLKQVARESRTVPAATAAAVMPARTNHVAPPAVSSSMAADAAAGDAYTPAAEPRETPFPTRSYVHEEEPGRGFFSWLLPWAGWAVAAGLAASTWTFYQRTAALSNRVAFANASTSRALAGSARAQAVLETLRSDAAQRFVLTQAAAAPVPTARVAYLASSGSLVFQGSRMEPLPPDKTYELWLIPGGDDAKPIPAGTFKPDARGFASVILPAMPKGTVAANFGITMENDGGSQAPTLPILMAGAA